MPRILVIGGSIAGLFAGILLRRAGCDVAIYERAGEALASRGAGITTHDELYAALAQAGVTVDRELAIETEGRVLLDHAGAVLGELAMPQLMTSWGLLYRFLRERFPDTSYHNGRDLRAVAQTASTVTAHFADGSSACGDYLVGADGARSTVRELLVPASSPRYVGYTAWRGLADEAALPEADHARLAGRFTLCLPPGEHMLGYMVAGPGDTVAPGQRWYNWIWYRPAAAAGRLRELLTGRDGVHYPLGIPHHLIRPEFIDDMRADAERLIAPPLRAAIAATPAPFLQPVHEYASERLIFGRVALLGDAAFTARPHVGLGVSKAATDAALLAAAFRTPASGRCASLKDWERGRLAFGRAVVAHSARLGCYLDGAAATDPATKAEQEFYRSPAVVLARIAARDPQAFLDPA